MSLVNRSNTQNMLADTERWEQSAECTASDTALSWSVYKPFPWSSIEEWHPEAVPRLWSGPGRVSVVN